MKAKQILARLAAGLLLAIFIAYIGYQVVSNLSDSIVTVDAVLMTAEDVISVEGFFVRSEVLVHGDSSSTAEYLLGDGEKAANGQDLVIFLESGAAVSSYQELQAISNQIEALEYAKNALATGADGKKLDGQVYSSLIDISGQLATGNAAKAAEDYPLLQQLIVGRGANVSQKEEYDARLEALKAELAAHQSSLKGSYSKVTAPCSGYFFRYPDGLETVLTPQTVMEMTPTDIQAVSAEGAVFSADVVGTVVDSYQWYFAAALEKNDADIIKDRATLDIYFPQIGSESINVKLSSAKTYGTQTAIVLESGLMHSQYLSTRFQPLDIVTASYTGIKVPREALRQVDGQWGVYCLDGALSKFKPVKWIYQTDSYVLVEQAKSSSDGLFMYDKIITKGKALEDNKVVR